MRNARSGWSRGARPIRCSGAVSPGIRWPPAPSWSSTAIRPEITHSCAPTAATSHTRTAGSCSWDRRAPARRPTARIRPTRAVGAAGDAGDSRLMPVSSMTRRLPTSHGNAARATSAMRWFRNPKPSNRKSTSSTAPPITDSPSRCTDSMTAKAHDDDRIAVPIVVASHHSKKGHSSRTA